MGNEPSEISVVDRLEALRKVQNEEYKKHPSSYNEGWGDGLEEAIQIVERYWRSYLRTTESVDLEKCIVAAMEQIPSLGHDNPLNPHAYDPCNAVWARQIATDVAKAVLDAAGLKYVD